jgi:hypothetical protein
MYGVKGENNVFIVPPHSRLKVKNGEYVERQALKMSLIESVEITRAYTSTPSVIPRPIDPVEMASFHVTTRDGRTAEIQFHLNYEHMFNNQAFDETRFKSVINQLRRILQDLETGGCRRVYARLGLYPNISVNVPVPIPDSLHQEDFLLKSGQQQEIIDKIFDDLPLPVNLSLYRYMYTQEKLFSLVLLSPKVDIEANLPIYQRMASGSIVYNQGFFPNNRMIYDIIKGKDGKLLFDIFNEHLILDPNYENDLDRTNKKVFSVDALIDLDNIIRSLSSPQYIALYQRRYIVGTTDRSTPTDSEAKSDEGTYVLFSNDISLLSAIKDETAYSDFKSAVFGLRSMAKPVIKITENNRIRYIDLGLLSNYYHSEMGELRRSELWRLYNGKYHKVKSTFPIYFLPGDKHRFN